MRSLLLAAVGVALLGADASATVITYLGDSLTQASPGAAERDWLAAAQPLSGTQGLESQAVTNDAWPLTTLTGGGVTISGAQTPFGVWDNPIAGDHATDGTQWIQTLGEANATSEHLTFDGFRAPLRAFGLWVTDYETEGALTLSIDGAAAQTFTILQSGAGRPSGSTSFFGLTAGAGEEFTEVTLAWNRDFIGVDKIMFAGAGVPEPGILALLACGGLALAAGRRRGARVPGGAARGGP